MPPELRTTLLREVGPAKPFKFNACGGKQRGTTPTRQIGCASGLPPGEYDGVHQQSPHVKRTSRAFAVMAGSSSRTCPTRGRALIRNIILYYLSSYEVIFCLSNKFQEK